MTTQSIYHSVYLIILSYESALFPAKDKEGRKERKDYRSQEY